MVKIIEGKLLAGCESHAIVVSQFNHVITKRLLEGAIDTLKQYGVTDEQITVVWVPGSFEIPLVADRLAKSGRFAAISCLGAVIKGETSHHEYINQQVAQGILQAGQSSRIPVLFGVLTCETFQQALDRAGGKTGNKGSEAALAAIQMVNTLKTMADENLWPKDL